MNGRIYYKDKRWSAIFGPSNPRFGTCGKAWRVGHSLGPSDLGLDCDKT